MSHRAGVRSFPKPVIASEPVGLPDQLGLVAGFVLEAEATSFLQPGLGTVEHAPIWVPLNGDRQ